MKAILKKMLTSVATSAPLAALAGVVQAQTSGGTSGSTSGTSRLPLPQNVQFIPTRGTLESSAVDIINFGLGFVGLVAVGFLIYGGFLYITSQGDEHKNTTAKNVLVYAIIGLLVILLSFVIVRAVANIL